MAIAIRPATIADIPTIHAIRLSVRENRLAEDTAITEQSSVPFVESGAMWVATLGEGIAGFAALDFAAASVWALFVDPDSEGLGAGRALHAMLIAAARERHIPRLTLSTSPGTRAERFYRTNGWTVVGTTGSEELRMERVV